MELTVKSGEKFCEATVMFFEHGWTQLSFFFRKKWDGIVQGIKSHNMDLGKTKWMPNFIYFYVF